MTINKMFQMSAMMAAFASASFAQLGLKAKIDFPFAAQGVTMEPGTYKLTRTTMNSGLQMYSLRNIATNHAILIPNVRWAEVNAATPAATKLVFQCGAASACRLTQVHEGSRQFGEVPSFGKPNRDSEESLTEVAMTKASGRGL